MGDIPRPGVHVPGRSDTGRQPSPSDSLRSISFRLEPRDYALAHLLHDHRTLTTAHITATLFTSTRTCRNRLAALRALGFIDSFIPVRPGGRLPLHWLPGPLSARYVALATGAKPPTAKALREQQDRLVAATAHLAHTDATNQVFIDLIAAARTTPGARLTRWWPAATIASATGRRVHPDGHGVWRQNNVQVAWFLEMDLGTESLPVLADKLPAYWRLREAGGPDWPVLILLPSPARETHLHQHLAGAGRLGVTVATATHAQAHTDPTGPIWRLVGNGRRRHRLVELPGDLGASGPFHPGPPAAEQDPLYLLGPITGERTRPGRD
ncbi:replication-relaxation family protein [Rugosimonospora africana]|uniref:replication-relaxation family protein n=1 Tax=Rugosimonospora africana TaxID=556532 RepID=UPI001943D572|nr:replication-relaxation family protein [Rugosimonospora africana]